MPEAQDLRERNEGESPYDYCLYLIDQGKLKRAERWVERGKVEEMALRRILGDQIEFVRRIRKALQKGKQEKAEKLRHCLISPIVRRHFKNEIAALGTQRDGAEHVEAAQTGEEDVTDESEVPEMITVESQEPQSLARGLLLKKLDRDAGRYSEAALDAVTRIIERTWLRERAGKHVLGVGRMDILVILECLSVVNGSTLTLDTLLSNLGRTKAQVRDSVRGLQRHYLRDSGFRLEGDINGEGVRFVASSDDTTGGQA